MNDLVTERPAPVSVVADAEASALSDLSNELRRDVHGVLGIPIDVTDMDGVLARIYAATAAATPLWISTPNLDFLASSRSDPEFRESLLLSDLCVPDGMPIVWISRMLGIPIKRRIAGADIFAGLKLRVNPRLTTFLFGGAEGIAERASRRINQEKCGLTCVGTLNPGFRPVEEMGGSDVIDTVNLSSAHVLAIGLPARKGQPWLLRNRHRLTIPVRASLGATLNFQAGSIARAPAFMRSYGLEWLWRIKQEPYLWKRYWSNLCTLAFLLLTRVFPLAVWGRCARDNRELTIQRGQGANATVLHLTGAAVARHVAKAATWIGASLSSAGPMTIDMSKVTTIDTRFIGLLLMTRKSLGKLNQPLRLVGVSFRVRTMMQLNGFGFLLEASGRG
ncbi:MAG: WecB/TagA/CpsF family glycosyltransferase [Bradyrhizobium sp.]|nr:WecB/TagA/CpsF family glycosyltransferase [Bradyrhizobium sp.]